MRKIYSVFVICFLLFSCDDGDIITAELEFGNTFEACGELIVYKTKTQPNESLSLQIDVTEGTTIDSLLKTIPSTTNPLFVDLVNPMISFPTGNQFNYRTYNNDPTTVDIFCNDVPPSNITITQDYSSTEVSAVFTISLEEDDNDGIPAEFEDINGNGNLDDDDTDGDGLPNYLDDDDDGDNVRTISESPNYSTVDGLANALNTDAATGDTIPDYLDPDDDGDGVLTRDEENDSQDQDPTNDITDNSVGSDYLNDQVSTSVPATAYREHTIGQTFEVRLLLMGINIAILSQDELDFGILQGSATTSSRQVTPTF
ncbi:hypothetical protein [Pontimicrobium sp. MEBiC01747]